MTCKMTPRSRMNAKYSTPPSLLGGELILHQAPDSHSSCPRRPGVGGASDFRPDQAFHRREVGGDAVIWFESWCKIRAPPRQARWWPLELDFFRLISLLGDEMRFVSPSLYPHQAPLPGVPGRGSKGKGFRSVRIVSFALPAFQHYPLTIFSHAAPSFSVGRSGRPLWR